MKYRLTKPKGENPISNMLSLLKVKYTISYANKYYNEHPHKFNLFGLSKMLMHFGVKNIGIKSENKENDINQLKPPFIAHIGSDFVTVEKISNKDVTYYWNNQKITVSIPEFTNIWSGATLIAEEDEDSIEPNYRKNRKEELINRIQQNLLLLGGIVLLLIAFIGNQVYLNIGLLILLVVNIVGVYIGALLVQKQLKIKSNHADKICSLFRKSNCNDILDSTAAKFLGIIGWSELGLSYFLTNTFIILFASHLLPYLALINVVALPYSIWSVWYQKFRAKQWCPLCLIVQLLLWSVFITSLVSCFIQVPSFALLDIVEIGLIYSLPFLIINLCLPLIGVGRKVERITQEFNSLKMNNSTFRSQLLTQNQYQVNKETSSILLGNPNAKIFISIFTNPHCAPCARMHSRIEELLKEDRDKFCVQYILSSFTAELDSSCEFFIWANEHLTPSERDEVYNYWFVKGKNEYERLFKDYGFTPDTNSDEYKLHKVWKEDSKLRATPTILVNGYELPKSYTIEDLKYFTDLDIDTK